MDRRSADGAGRLASAAALLALLLAAPIRAQTTTRVSVSTGGAQGNAASEYPSISPDGRYIAFRSAASNLVAGDTNAKIDIFVRDRVSGTTERVNMGFGGAQADDDSYSPVISADGRYVAFPSAATNLVLGDNNAVWDIFVRDRQLGTTERVSVATNGAQGNDYSDICDMSADGRFVAFQTNATNFAVGDTSSAYDVYVRDRLLNTTVRASVTSAGAEANGDHYVPGISDDGRYVSFQSDAPDLVPLDTNATFDIFVHDLLTGVTERVSVHTSGAQGDNISLFPTISGNGRYVVFQSYATTLVDGDTNVTQDVFVHDRLAGTTERASVGPAGVQGNSGSGDAGVSADGLHVTFTGFATNFVSGDTNAVQDVFVHDLLAGTTERISVDTSGLQANGRSFDSPTSADGHWVAFMSEATNLAPGDTNGVMDIFVRERRPPFTTFCFGDGLDTSHTTPCPCSNFGAPGRGCAHSFDPSGARLTANGSQTNDDLQLASSSEPASSFTLFLQHDALGDFVFHDGVLCAGGTLIRLRGRNAILGAASFPNPLWDSSITLSQRGGVFPGQGVRRYYSAWYRNASTTFCPPATANVTNGVYVDW